MLLTWLQVQCHLISSGRFFWEEFLKNTKEWNKYFWLVPTKVKKFAIKALEWGRMQCSSSWSEYNKTQYYQRSWCDFPNRFPMVPCCLNVLYILKEVDNARKIFLSRHPILSRRPDVFVLFCFWPACSGLFPMFNCHLWSAKLMPHSHQGLNTFKRCLVKHSLNKFVSFIKAAFGWKHKLKITWILCHTMVQFSVTNFHFVKRGLIKHVLLVWMGIKLSSWLPLLLLLYSIGSNLLCSILHGDFLKIQWNI